MRKHPDYFGQAGPQSPFKDVGDWETSMQSGIQSLSRNAGNDINEIMADYPVGGPGVTDPNDINSQMNRRQQAINKRNAMLARQTSDFRDAMGKQFGSWKSVGYSMDRPGMPQAGLIGGHANNIYGNAPDAY